jgi:hypothetical protein
MSSSIFPGFVLPKALGEFDLESFATSKKRFARRQLGGVRFKCKALFLLTLCNSGVE